MPESSDNAILSPLQYVQRFLVGLGGSVAGISALMYACGYLVSRGHLNSLGLYGVIEETTDSFLQEGGKFFFVTSYLIIRWTMAVLPIALIVTLIVLVIFWVSQLPKVSASMTRLIPSRVREKVTPIFRRRALYALAVAALIWLVNRFLDDAQAPALVSNLLFASGAVTAGATQLTGLGALADSIKQALLRGDDSYVDTIYGLVLFGAVASASLTIAVWRLTLLFRYRLLACSPFMVGAAVFGLLLPFDYGVLQRSAEFPRVIAHLDSNADTTGFLVQKSTSGLLLWDQARHQLNAISESQVKGLEITGNDRLFSKTTGTVDALKE